MTLAEYYRSQLIPRGLRVHIVPTLFAQDEEYRKRFTQIINKCSFDLITLTVEFLQKERITITQEITDLEKQLSEILGQQDFLKTKKQIWRKNWLHTGNLFKTPKRTKMHHDRDDYTNNRDYNWSESNSF